MKEIGEQFTLFDYLEEVDPIKLGKYNPNLKQRRGKMIPFSRLEEYIGKNVILQLNSRIEGFKVIKITSFQKNMERVYQSPNGLVGEWLYDNIYSESVKSDCVFQGLADRIGYSDNEKGKENSWVSEIFCTNGRYTPTISSTECMYEIVA